MQSILIFFLRCSNLATTIGVLCIRELGIMHSTELLKGTLQTIILKILADHGKMYGYEITQRVKELSAGTILLTEGALYPTLHKMEAEGFLKTETETIGKRMRKYYSLTPIGKNVVEDKVSEFIAFIKTMSTVLNVTVA
jgi:PadR family transcriptional regulator, regulatory protein PadR